MNVRLWHWLKNRRAREMTKRPYGKQKETPERAPKWVRNRAAEHRFCANSFSINHIIHSVNDKHLRKLLFHSAEMRNSQLREGSNLPKATQIHSSRAGTGNPAFLIPRPQLFTLYYSAWGKPCNLSEIPFPLLYNRDCTFSENLRVTVRMKGDG